MSYILFSHFDGFLIFYDPLAAWLFEPHILCTTSRELVSLAAVFSLVTQRSSPEERCVTSLKTAARESSRERMLRDISMYT